MEFGSVSAEKLSSIKMQVNHLMKDVQEVSKLHAGSCFGEAALLSVKNQRLATIKCVTDCYFGILSRESFEATVAKV